MVQLYVLRSFANGRRYVGITATLDVRLRVHARKATKGGQALGRFELIHREEFPNHVAARVREKFLKSGKGHRWLDTQFGINRSETDVDTALLQPSVRAVFGV